MNSPNKNRKWWWLAAACLVLWYFAPGAVQSFREASAYQQRVQAMRAQAQSAGGTANTNTAIPSGPIVPNAPAPRYASANPAVPVSALAGIWSGNETQHTGDMCSLSLELRDKADGMTAGYANMICRPILRRPGAPMPNANEIILKAMTPMAAILSGQMKDGSVVFHVDKAIGTPVDGCPFSALTVTPFGTQQIAVEWQRGSCDSGQMTMTRAAQ